MKNNYLLTLLKGMLMGIADVIPGVSGGTIAFITGIYHRLIHAISHIKLELLTSLLKLDFKRFKSLLSKVDLKFLIPLAIGILISILTFARLITSLMSNYPSFTFAFFFGLILASALIMKKEVKKINFEKSLFFIFGFLIAYLLSSTTSLFSTHSLPFILIAGSLAICAMLLPGISGAFILLLLGQYQYILQALHEFNLKVILTFILGAIIGLITFSKIIDYFIENHKYFTFAFLIGLMIGSLKVLLKNIQSNYFLSAIFAIIGFIIVIGINKYSK
jgi:putative membrane protein